MGSRTPVAASAALLALVLLAPGLPVSAADRHDGYYYPGPQSREVYEARAQTLPDADRHRRLGFITALTAQMLDSPYPPQFAVFAKGDGAEKLIIVGLYDNGYNTLFRARALLAMLTAVSRRTSFFRNSEVADRYTFFDLLVLLGFKQLTISDGDEFAHQVEFE